MPKVGPGSVRTLAIDLCAGAGGASCGLGAAGFEVLGVELDPVAAQVHRTHVGPCDTADITQWSPPKSGQYTLVAAGVPCTVYSSAGTRLGEQDPRGRLWREWIRVAVATNADAVMLENVQAMALEHVPTREALFEALTAVGYHGGWTILNSADYGVPQLRNRLFIVGFRDPAAAKRFRWPEPSHGPPNNVLGLPEYVTVRQALGLRGQYATTRRLARATRSRKEGAAHGGARGWWQGGRAIDVDRPSYTVTTRNNADLLVAADDVAREEIAAMRRRSGVRQRTGPDEYRLGLRELAVLQGWPPDVEFRGTSEQKHRQMGNACPPALAEAVGREIRSALVK